MPCQSVAWTDRQIQRLTRLLTQLTNDIIIIHSQTWTKNRQETVKKVLLKLQRPLLSNDIMKFVGLVSISLVLKCVITNALVFPTQRSMPFKQSGKALARSSLFSKSDSSVEEVVYTLSPLFNFSNIDENDVSNFERIDDAIMGGISLSSIRQNAGENFARWSGICRIDGGGFCGTRTLPFKTPLFVEDAEGIYLSCRLTSDDEPERRIWKVTTRTEESRSEQLYQSMFDLPKTNENNDFNIIKIPFEKFVQVRGPRIVEGGPNLNTKNGLFQIGLALSKFQISSNGTQIEDFRPGYFELQLKEIGFYKTGESPVSVAFPGTLGKKEAERKKPLILKILGPIAKTLFSEKRRRRASAMRLLKKRGFTRYQASLFGLQLRANRNGWPVAIAQSIVILMQEAATKILFWTLRIGLVYPITLLRKVAGLFIKAKRPVQG